MLWPFTVFRTILLNILLFYEDKLSAIYKKNGAVKIELLSNLLNEVGPMPN